MTLTRRCPICGLETMLDLQEGRRLKKEASDCSSVLFFVFLNKL